VFNRTPKIHWKITADWKQKASSPTSQLVRLKNNADLQGTLHLRGKINRRGRSWGSSRRSEREQSSSIKKLRPNKKRLHRGGSGVSPKQRARGLTWRSEGEEKVKYPVFMKYLRGSLLSGRLRDERGGKAKRGRSHLY